MILCPNLGSNGRLGNQLFQYASTKALAIEKNVEAKLPPDLDSRIWHGQVCLLNHFKIADSKYTEEEYNSITNEYHLPNDCHTRYATEFWDLPATCKLYGFFESEYYFKKHKEIIKRQLQFHDDIEAYSKNYIQQIKYSKPEHEVVAIHIRRRVDHIVDKASTESNIAFIKKAIQTYFSSQCVFLIFAGGGQSSTNEDDIKRYKAYFDRNSFLFCEINDPIRELCIIKNCDHAIGFEYSTFFWWGAYLNTNLHKRIIVPSKFDWISVNPDIFWSDEFIKMDLNT